MSPEQGAQGWGEGVIRRVPPQGSRLIDAGWKVTDITRDLGLSTQTIDNWRRQHRVDLVVAVGELVAVTIGFAVAGGGVVAGGRIGVVIGPLGEALRRGR